MGGPAGCSRSRLDPLVLSVGRALASLQWLLPVGEDAGRRAWRRDGGSTWASTPQGPPGERSGAHAGVPGARAGDMRSRRAPLPLPPCAPRPPPAQGAPPSRWRGDQSREERRKRRHTPPRSQPRPLPTSAPHPRAPRCRRGRSAGDHFVAAEDEVLAEEGRDGPRRNGAETECGFQAHG